MCTPVRRFEVRQNIFMKLFQFFNTHENSIAFLLFYYCPGQKLLPGLGIKSCRLLIFQIKKSFLFLPKAGRGVRPRFTEGGKLVVSSTASQYYTYTEDNRIIYLYNCKSYQHLGPQTLAYTVPYGKTKSTAKKLDKAKIGKEKRKKDLAESRENLGKILSWIPRRG